MSEDFSNSATSMSLEEMKNLESGYDYTHCYSEETQSSQSWEDEENVGFCNYEAAENSSIVHNEPDRKSSYKILFDPLACQENRRREALESQKKRRNLLLDRIRQIDSDSVSESESDDMELEFTGFNSTSGKKKQGKRKTRNCMSWRNTVRNSSAPCRVMLSEWLREKPEDFEHSWLGVMCPVGKRCLVVGYKGKTRVYSRTQQFLGSFSSMLPGGSRLLPNHSSKVIKGVTILDCIWSENSQAFYVLDLICWSSYCFNNCTTEYRQFFLQSKLTENPEMLERQKYRNPYPFVLLKFFPASELSEVVLSTPNFPERVDGFLFFHKETFYVSKVNPLILWIRLSQMESHLHLTVPPELLSLEHDHPNPPKNVPPIALDNKANTEDITLE